MSLTEQELLEIKQRAERSEDAEFIAHAREDIPRLIAEIRRLREEREALREVVKYALGYAEFVNKIVWLVQHDEELEDAVRDLKSFIEGSGEID